MPGCGTIEAPQSLADNGRGRACQRVEEMCGMIWWSNSSFYSS